MLALNAQAQAAQSYPSSPRFLPITPGEPSFAGPWATGLQLHISPSEAPFNLAFISGIPTAGHPATVFLLRSPATSFQYSNVDDWNPEEQAPIYDEFAVGDERRFPDHPRAQKMLAEVGKQSDGIPLASPVESDGSGTSTPSFGSLGSSGLETPEGRMVGTPPVKPKDEDILWFTPSKRAPLTMGVEVVGNESEALKA